MKTVKTLPIRQQGSTLIEIMVSMFILALGLMALIAMQTRTSIGIKEAENQTIIAQATENLAENMMTNPVLDISQLTTKRSYDHYVANGTTRTIDCSANNAVNDPNARVFGDTGRKALADYHVAYFGNEACKVSGYEGDVKFSIDNNTTGTTAANGQTLHVTWTVGGSSGKEFTYDYPLDDNL